MSARTGSKACSTEPRPVSRWSKSSSRGTLLLALSPLLPFLLLPPSLLQHHHQHPSLPRPPMSLAPQLPPRLARRQSSTLRPPEGTPTRRSLSTSRGTRARKRSGPSRRSITETSATSTTPVRFTSTELGNHRRATSGSLLESRPPPTECPLHAGLVISPTLCT